MKKQINREIVKKMLLDRYTLKSIGQKFGVSKQRIFQISRELKMKSHRSWPVDNHPLTKVK